MSYLTSLESVFISGSSVSMLILLTVHCESILLDRKGKLVEYFKLKSYFLTL